MTSKTNKTTKGATTLSSSDERVAEGLAFKDATGTYSEFLLIYEEPGPTGLRTCGKALADAHGNEFPCLKKQGRKAIWWVVIGGKIEGGAVYGTRVAAEAVQLTGKGLQCERNRYPSRAPTRPPCGAMWRL